MASPPNGASPEAVLGSVGGAATEAATSVAEGRTGSGASTAAASKIAVIASVVCRTVITNALATLSAEEALAAAEAQHCLSESHVESKAYCDVSTLNQLCLQGARWPEELRLGGAVTHFPVGANVDYNSRSLDRWIPAQVQSFDSKDNTYLLDCTSRKVPQERIRWPIHFPESAKVEYDSKSFGFWIPAKVQSFNLEKNTYKLDCKSNVPAGKIRWPLNANFAWHASLFAVVDRTPFTGQFDFEEGQWCGIGAANFAFRDALRFGAGTSAEEHAEDPEWVYRSLCNLGMDKTVSLLRLGWCDRRRPVSSPMQTPLHFAARNGNSGAARLLLAQGADPDVADVHGETPVSLAAFKQEQQMLQLLMPHSKVSGFLPLVSVVHSECRLMRRLTAAGKINPSTALARHWVALGDDIFNLIGTFLPVFDEALYAAVRNLVVTCPELRLPATPALADASFPIDGYELRRIFAGGESEVINEIR